MSATLVNAYVLYNGTTGQYVGDSAITITINCERVRAFSPRPVWLKRFLAPGDGTVVLYEPTFNPSSAELLDPNTLQGFWVEQDGQDIMIDITNINAFQQACNACCGSVPTVIANLYAGAPTAFSALTVTTLCIYAFDDGSAGAHDAFAARYVGNVIGTVVMRSNFSGTSHYTIQTYWTLANFPLQLNDTVYTGACAS